MDRIVSLVPSHTLSLWDLGLADRVVGRTRFCIHPAPWVETLPIVGGTKDAKLDKILALKPGLVVADKDENPKTLVDGLGAAGLEVLWSDIATLEDAAGFVERLGKRCGAEAAGRDWSSRIRSVSRPLLGGRAVPVFVPIWHAPWMAFDRTAYPDAVLRACGLRNVFAEHQGPRYFEVSEARVAASEAEYALLPTEPFPFHKKTVATAGLGACGAADRVRVIDGEDLTWFGTRTATAVERLRAATADLRLGG